MRIYLIFLLIFPQTAFCKCNVATALSSIREGAVFSVYDDDYATVRWEGPGVKPTEKEVNDEIAACNAREILEKQLREQAKLDLNNPLKTDAEFRAALIKYLGLDR